MENILRQSLSPSDNENSELSNKKTTRSKTLLATALVGGLALAACSDNPNSIQDTEIDDSSRRDAGTSDTSNDSNQQDAGLDSTASDTQDTSLDLDTNTDETTTIDADVDASEVLDSDLVDDSISDTTDLPEIKLVVSNVAGEVQVLDPATDSGEIEIANFELCAENGDVVIDSIQTNFRGNFSTLPAVLTIQDLTQPITLRSSDDNLFLLASDGVTIDIADRTCENLVLTVDFAEAIESGSEWIRFKVKDVGVLTPNVTVQRGLDRITINPDFEETSERGVHTVFVPFERFRVTSRVPQPVTETVLEDRTNSNIPIGRFELRTNGNELATLYGANFMVEAVPSDALVPIGIDLYMHDGITERGYSLRGISDIYSGGSEIPFVLSPSEDFSFDSVISIEFSVPFVPDNLDAVKISMIGLDSDITTEMEFIISDPYSSSRIMPLDWNWVEFILPDSAPIANFRFNSFNPYQSDWFVWQTEFGDVIRDGACSSDCSLLSGSVEVQGITDTRLPATLNGLNLDINNSSDDPLIFNVRLTTGYEDGPFHVEHMTDSIAVAPNSTTTFDLSDLSIRLDSLNDYRFKINIDLPDTGLPVENPTSLLPEYITFDINSIDMEYQYAPLRVVVNGRETAGVGSWGEYPLPYTSAKINFEDPEIFLNTVSSRFQTVDLSEYEGEAIDIFNATFDNLNGTVKVCQVTFEHDIVKEEVPFESLYVIIDGNIGVNTYWASGEADFTFSTCPQIGQQNGFEVRVEGYGPELEPDETELRARFSLAAMNASAVLPDSDFRIIATPVYTDIDSRGYPIEIADNPVNGALNVITR